MTSKELLYVSDALEHECFMKSCTAQTASKLSDMNLTNYMQQLSKEHTDLFNNLLNLL